MLIYQPCRGRDATKMSESVLDPFAVGQFWVFPEKGLLSFNRMVSLFARTSEPSLRDELVIFSEPNKNSREHPRDCRLNDSVIPPGSPGHSRAPCCNSLLVLILPFPMALLVS